MRTVSKTGRYWAAGLALLWALLLGPPLGVLSGPAGVEPGPEAPTAAPVQVLATPSGPVLQPPDLPEASPSPSPAVQPEASDHERASGEVPSQPTATSTVATGLGEVPAPAESRRAAGADLSAGVEPLVPAEAPTWLPGAGSLPPPFGGPFNPFLGPPLFPPPLLPPALVVVPLPAAVAPGGPAITGSSVVSLMANVPALTGLVGVPCAVAIGATCTVAPLAGLFTVTGSMRYTITATGPAGTLAGGVPAVFVPTTAGVERFACTAVTAQLQTTCSGTTVGNALQGGVVTVRFPLVGGGTRDRSGIISGPGPQATATRTPTRTPTPVSTPVAVVPCRDVRTLRELAGRLQTITNPRTGQTVEYLVMGDGARSNELLVFFNGTSQILPDWPIQMITNNATSPLITTTAAYTPDQESTNSLCRDYRLVFFDYPGVGLSPGTTGVTHDQIASDVDAMLVDVGQKYRIATNNVSVVGWSLGTEAALKYAFLSPASNPSRTIRNVVLIATKPGGGQSDQTNGNGADCVQETFNVLENPSLSAVLRARLEATNYQLLYPYQGQQPYNGPTSGCTIDIDTTTDRVSLSVTPGDCGIGMQCAKIAAEFAANRLTAPWSRTGGVPQGVYVNQRQLTQDWNYSYCATAGVDFRSSGCTSLPSQPPKLSATNGGVCKTSTPAGFPNLPTTAECVPLQIQGRLTVINGPQDLYIQHTYGAALVAGYQRQYGTQKAALVTYPGADGAGHGVLLQHPRFVQDAIFAALQAAVAPSPSSARP
jgi:pimeloyl-ACP methyl ester carboxylesterase